MSDFELWLDRMPRPGETCVISDSEVHWRRDALMFDRVFAPLAGPGMAEPGMIITPRNVELPDIPLEFSFGSALAEQQYCQSYSVSGPAALHLTPEEVSNIHLMFRTDRYSQSRTMAVWSESERAFFLRRFSEGERIAYEGALNNVPVVSQDVGWDEVRAFREDPESVRKYRDLRLWLLDGLKATSVGHATDVIGQKIDDYRFAVRKHGLQTKIGAISNLFEWKSALPMAGSAGAAAAVGGGGLALIAGGLAIGASIGAWLMERRLSGDVVERGEGREVAILVDMQNRFGPMAEGKV